MTRAPWNLRRTCALLAWALAASAAPAAELRGRVVTDGEVPIEHARVDVVESGRHAFTDGGGRFSLSDVSLPAQLVASHPRFHAQVVDLTAEDGEELVITLVAKQEIFEEIVVSANRGEDGFAPVSVAAVAIEPTEVAVPPTSLTQTIAEIPGVSENGQGGLFQVFSIRGISRQRLLTMIEGTRVVSDRRAGVSASFIEPQLLDKVDVVQGPSSTYYGSGALGGVVQLFPKRFDTLDVRLGYESQGDENFQSFGWGSGGWSLGLARRAAGRAEDGEGGAIPSGFEQISGTLRRSWESESLEWDVLVLGSAGRDIEKASTDFPGRETVYPEENHLLVRVGVAGDAGWSAFGYVHPNDLTTRVLRVDESLNVVDSESTELGASWQRKFDTAGTTAFALGAEYFGRRGVSSLETDTDISALGTGESVVLETLDDAEEDQLGAYGAMEWNWGEASFSGGLRGTWQRQVNASEPSRDDQALAGFLGMVATLGEGFELTANVGSGLRFPTLAERFFSGTTGRGGVIGNPDLEPERSLSVDLGLRWYGERLFVSGYVYRTDVDEYIERVEVAPDLLTFVNLVSGKIEGLEIFGSYRASTQVTLEFGGHLTSGEDSTGGPLADIPANRFDLGGSGQHGAWGWRARWEYREAKDDPGPGEMKIPSAELLAARVSYRLTDALTVSLNGRNLLDEVYFNSADDKVPLAAGRSVGVGLTYRPGS